MVEQNEKTEEDKPKTLAPDRPDLIFLPDVPPERDTRKGTSGGYVFVSQEQYVSDAGAASRSRTHTTGEAG